MGDAQSAHDYSFLDGVKGNFHGLSHHRDIPETRAQYEKIIDWHTTQLAYMLTKMKSLKEGDGTLLDHSMVLFGSSIRCGNRHIEENLPLLLAGRGNGDAPGPRRIARSCAVTKLRISRGQCGWHKLVQLADF